jgi:hypothetical protein
VVCGVECGVWRGVWCVAWRVMCGFVWSCSFISILLLQVDDIKKVLERLNNIDKLLFNLHNSITLSFYYSYSFI